MKGVEFAVAVSAVILLLCRGTVQCFSPTSAARKASETTTLFSTPSSSNGLSRRQVGELTVAAVGLGITALGTREVEPTDYGLWGILPVGTYKSKKTIRETIVPDNMWTFDQKFGIE